MDRTDVTEMAHFVYIHLGFPTYVKNVFEGHIASQYLRTVGPRTSTWATNRFEIEVASKTGTRPHLGVVELRHIYPAGGVARPHRDGATPA
jgi:hypothetical protein